MDHIEHRRADEGEYQLTQPTPRQMTGRIMWAIRSVMLNGWPGVEIPPIGRNGRPWRDSGSPR